MLLRRLAAASVLAALFAAGAGTASASGPAWSATATQAITSLNNGTDLGPTTSSTPIQISAGLSLRNQAALHTYINDVSTPGNAMYGQSLTPAQFKAQYSPTDGQAAAVEIYLQGKGFQNLSVSSNNIYVTGWATPAQAETAFNTQIDSFSENGSTVFANVTPAMVPASLGGLVISVLGLTNAFKMQLPLHDTATPSPQTPSTNVPNSFWAPGFQQAYDATGTAPASKTAIAIMAEGDVTQVVTDLRDYEADPSNGGLPQIPVTVEHVGVPSPDTAGLTEFDMDTQTSTGLAGDVQRLYIYDATSLTDSDVALEFNTFAQQDLAKAGSASFGECEYAAYLDGFMVANDEAMSEAAAQGQTLFASAGDSGGFCAATGALNGVPMAGEPFVNYPASSPYVTAVGGSTLVTNSDGSYGEELAWDAGGGGVSYFESQPIWQSGTAPPTGLACQVQLPACPGRALPDIAMDADFVLAAANFYSVGQPTSNGGTSLASPLALGSWARIETGKSNGIGFASPSIYGATGTLGLHDITIGDNGPYPATPGWDFATGNGSFDIANMIKVINVYPQATFPPVPAPACNEAYGNGFAQPLGATSDNHALAIEAAGLSSDRANKTITALIRVKSLTDGPGGLPTISGSGDQWYFEFTWTPKSGSSTRYFLGATYDPSTIANSANPQGFAFAYGHGSSLTQDGSATGSVDFSNGIISITAPWSDFGGQLSPAVATPTINDPLTNLGAASYDEAGSTSATGNVLDFFGNSASGTNTYLVGHVCNPASIKLDATSLNHSYDGKAASVTATTNPAGLSYSVTYNGSSIAPTQAGTYNVAATITDLDHAGSNSGTLTIAQAPLTITAGSPSISYGQAIPAVGANYQGFVKGDSASSLTAAPKCSTVATVLSAAGSYPTSCSGAQSTDYAITYAAGSLTVKLAKPTIASTGASRFRHGGKAVLSAKMTSIVTNTAIEGRTLVFTLGKQSCSGATNSSGVATCTISKVTARSGSRRLSISFAGDSAGSSYDYSAAATATTVKIH